MKKIRRLDKLFIKDAFAKGGQLEGTDGGKGSGNFGHKGRPGEVGGSGEGGGEESAPKTADYTKKDSIADLEQRQKKAGWDTKRDELISRNLTPWEANTLEDFEVLYDSLSDAYDKCSTYDFAYALYLYNRALDGDGGKMPQIASPFEAIAGLDTIEGIKDSVKKLRELKESGAIIRDEDSDIATSFGVDKYGDSQYEKLCTAVDKCPDEAVRNAWELMHSSVSVLNAQADKGEWYFKMGAGVSVNVEQGMEAQQGYAPKEVLFHEIGHGIDNALGSYLYYDKGTPPFTEEYSCFSGSWNDGEFLTTMESEVKEYIASVEKSTLEDFEAHTPYTPENAQYMYDKGYFTMAINNEVVFNKLAEMALKDGAKSQTRNALMRSLGYDPYKPESENQAVKIATEAIAGFSAGKYCIGYGHSSDYYEGEQGRQSVAHEVFTELFTAAIVKPECITRFSKMFPKSYKTYQRMMSEVFG